MRTGQRAQWRTSEPISRARRSQRADALRAQQPGDRLADATYHMARIASVFSDPHKARYRAMRSRGHTHGRACRQLADQMLTTPFAMLRDRTLYDANTITTKAA